MTRKSPADMGDPKTDLNQLVIFSKVVETHSFTAAGRALGLPKSTVSRKIAQLEDRLGVQLLQRTTRRLSLTDIGAAFYERCARICVQVEEAEMAVLQMDQQPRGLLRVAAPNELGTSFLSEIVAEFLAAHRGVDIELELTERRVDPLEDGFDLVLELGESRVQDQGLACVELGPARRLVVASPAYLERRGVPRRLEDLEHHDLVVVRDDVLRGLPGDAHHGVSLGLRGPEGTIVSLSTRPRLIVNSTALLREALLSGVGIGVLPAFRCRTELESGDLCPLLDDWTRDDGRIHARYPHARYLAAKLRVFLEFVREHLEPSPRVGQAESSSVHAASGTSRHIPAQPSA